MNILDFTARKHDSKRITMVTAYDYWTARLVEESDVDSVLVGDSVAMVAHGHPTTLHATLEMMETHTAAVARAIRTKFLVADMPFLSFRKGIPAAMNCVERLMRAGAQAVKLEGVWGHEETIRAITQAGVPVMGHIGLTPQSIHGLGGFKVQGREAAAARDLLAQARKLEELGAFALVLECIPAAVSREITEALRIPTIGIGAGVHADGQVLVLQDLLGMNSEFKPKFLRHFLDGERQVLNALNRFHLDVHELRYPAPEECH